MTPEMKQRLLEYAAEEIERHSTELNYTGGNNVVVSDRLVTLPYPSEPGQEVKEENWELVIFAIMTTHDSVNGDTYYPLQAVSRVPRISGIPANSDAVWWESTQLRESSGAPQSTKTCSIEFFTRTFDPPTTTPIWENGLPYPGDVEFVMKQQVVGGPGTAIQAETVLIEPEGSGVIVFQASNAEPNGTLLELRPVSVSRVR